MDTYTVIFIGPPGCGKSTQSQLLESYLEEFDTDKHPVLSVDVGAAFRQLSHVSGSVSDRIEQEMSQGDLLPTFLSTYAWTNTLVTQLSSESHLLLDGSPRSLEEQRLLDEAFSFFRRQNLYVIHLEVSRDTALSRLSERGRLDDMTDVVKHRFQEYREETKPVIEQFRQADDYAYIHVDGEQSIEKIHEEIAQCFISN